MGRGGPVKGSFVPRTRRHGLLLRAALTTCLAASLAGISPASSQAAEKGVVTDMTWNVTPDDQDKTAAALKDTGAQWVRLNMSWYWLDAYPGSWAKYDRAVRLATEAGAKIVMMFNHSPQWASGSLNKEAPPLLPSTYADALRDLVARYRGKVAAYEIWNEPNHAGFWPVPGGPNPGAYARLLKAGAAAVRETDPDAKVVFGGLSRNDYAFVEGAYAAEPDLGDHFDVMALHPYTAPLNQAPEVIERAADGRISEGSFAGYRTVRDVMAANGDDKPVWFTEFGWSTATSVEGVTEEQQADYLTRAMEFVEQDEYVEVAIAYNFRNHAFAKDADNWVDRLGLMTTDFTPKPAYHAFKAYQEPVKPSPAKPTAVETTLAELPAEVVPESPTSSGEPVATTVDEPVPAHGSADAPIPPKAAAASVRVRIAGMSIRRARITQRSLRSGRGMRITGQVRGATGGKVALHLHRLDENGQWKVARRLTTRVASDGRFRSAVTLKRAGRWRLIAQYGGDESRRSATSKVAFRVVGA